MPKKRTVFKDEKYGKLTVAETTAGKSVVCHCECGRTISVAKHNLTSGKSKSCGKGVCQSGFKDMTGETFGYLTALEVVRWSDGKSSVVWKCLCICGTFCEVDSDCLRDGKTKSCGCMRSTLISRALSLSPGEINVRQIFANYRNGAKNRKIDFLLSLEEFRSFLFKNCHYCGAAPITKNVVENVQQENIVFYNGIDRIDNEVGYRLGNCITCCKICNYAKSALPYKDFIMWLDNLVKYRVSLNNMENVL